MQPHLPVLDPANLVPETDSGYPEPFRSRVLPREKRALGDVFGLTRIGVNLTTLAPGRESSMRHWHTREDELVYVLAGVLTLRTDSGAAEVRAGEVAGFAAGVADGHQFINNGAEPAVYLEFSNRDAEDVATYPDVDLKYDAGRYTRKDGLPL